MWEKIWKYRKEILLVILIFFAVSMIAHNSLNTQKPSFVSKILLTALSPFQKSVNYLKNTSDHFFEFTFGIMRLHEENTRLREELRDLQRRYNTVIEESLQLKRLSRLSDYVEESHAITLPAAVIGISPSPWSNMITINKGSRQGVKVDMPVVSENGLVGKVKEIGLNTSQVLLLPDKRSSVSALIQDTRERGVIMGKGVFDECTFIPENPAIALEQGQRIVTSGLGGSLYPKGVYIGEIVNVQKAKYGIYFANVEPAVNFNELETVLVITDTAGMKQLESKPVNKIEDAEIKVEEEPVVEKEQPSTENEEIAPTANAPAENEEDTTSLKEDENQEEPQKEQVAEDVQE